METMMDVAFTHVSPGCSWNALERVLGIQPIIIPSNNSPKQMNYHAISVTGTLNKKCRKYKGMKWFSETPP